jgi:hypothetical protein
MSLNELMPVQARKADRRLAVLFLPFLLNRCQFAIETYLADSKIRGKSPFPRFACFRLVGQA